jgi:uncharacterized protein (TIGR03067 family)
MSQSRQCLLAGTILLLVCCTAFGKGPRVKKVATDVERLQGTWLADLEPCLQGRLVLDGSHLLYVHINNNQETVIWDGHFAVNEQANPKQMDWTPLRKHNRNPPANLAIYHLEGDILLVIGHTEAARPTAFYSGGGAHHPKTVIFRRVPKEAEGASEGSSPANVPSPK